MKTFRCPSCAHTVFFENDHCGHCGAQLAFAPDAMGMVALDDATAWRACANRSAEARCNWAVPASSAPPLCCSCRHTSLIPPLAHPRNPARWAALELAKRRLFYTLLRLRLPLPEPPALQFQFKEQLSDDEKVLTGHASGCITINVAEADDAQREAIRTEMGEPYRTLLGHLRHEIGHFYWDWLIQGSEHLAPFRALFGDERADYGDALQRHYQQGAPPDWPQRCISAYAASHPWEDWAETWAHYLHIVDALETAAHWGVRLGQGHTPSLDTPLLGPVSIEPNAAEFRRTLIEQWLPLAQTLNSLGRSLGQGDYYPFVMPPPVVDKLLFVDGVVRTMLSAAASGSGRPD